MAIPPEWWIRLLVGALGGAASAAQRFLVTPAPSVSEPDRRLLWADLAARSVLGATAGFAVVVLPVSAPSVDAWLAWSLVAGFSGSGVLGSLATQMETRAQLRRASALRDSARLAAGLLEDDSRLSGPAPEATQQARVVLKAALEVP